MLTKKAIEVLKSVYDTKPHAAKINHSVCESENEWKEILDALDELQKKGFIHYTDIAEDVYIVDLESDGIVYCEQNGF